MLAAYYDRQGAADDVLVVGELPEPEPGFGEVRVRVAISGVNPTDIKARTGFAGAPMAFPRIVPHHDGAGTIDKIGPGVPEAKLGERVWLYRAQYGRSYGTAAEFVVVPSALAVSLPDNASFESGACLGVAAITAHRCLFADGDVRGRRVLVQGGGGAVGTAAILLAKWAGAWVAATVSRPEQEKVALDAGADLVINRHSEDVAAAIRHATKNAGVERIVDVDLANNVDVDIACLAPGGVVTAYATEDPAARLTMPFRTAMFGSFVFRFVFFTTIPEEAFRLAVKEVTACVAAGCYRPHIGLEVPIQKIAQAHAAQESGKVVGKILVRVGD
ncbi:NADPH:quinone reductase [Rhizobium leguminosarum]|uniref:NADPH:quinone reductase n=1 Tax=Rhizobium leguminosarum TaxID=384 RepID=UPI001C91162F|nr:NADPH:quinone reductase [Rhizobium leguminosarum]MBY2907693.1 NADPH:quinone reductase [Rhizobium leguminosarum]